MNLSPLEHDHEQGIDSTLKALSSTRPPEGMHDRILARLAQAEQEQPTLRPRRFAGLFTMPRLAGGFAIAGALTLCIVFTIRSAHHPVTPPSIVSEEPDGRPIPPQVPLSSIDMARRALPPSAIARSAKPPARSAQPSGSESSEPALAGFPAPEAPLTEQEKLLLHIARHPGPDEFALLNPEARDEVAQASRADFNQFFPQPVPQETFYESQQPKP